MKPKLLFILHIPPPIYGASVVGQYIKKSSLINESFIIDYVNLTTSFDLNRAESNFIRKFINFLKIQKKVFQHLWHNEYDLCYMTLTSSGPGFYKDLLVVALLKFFGKKIIYHFHNKGVLKASKNPVNKVFYCFVLNKAKCILLSPSLFYDIKKFISPSDVYYCPNGIPADTQNISKIIKKPGAPVSFLFFSNIMIEKGVLVLLEALKILKDAGLIFNCDFVGGWSDISENHFKTKIINKGLENSVYAHGPKYGDDKKKFFDQADVLVFPTFYHYETFGLVNLEAMQNGLAVISTFEGGIPDIVVDGETGFLVSQRDVNALAQKMKLFIENPELTLKMGMAGKKRYERLYTLEKFEERIVQILGKAVKKYV